MTERDKLERKHAGNLTRLANGASYISYDDEGTPCVVMFRPKSKKPWRRLRFENETQRDDLVNQFADQMSSEFDEKRRRREEKKLAVQKFSESVEEGELFAYEWGTVDRQVWFYILVDKMKNRARLMRIGAKKFTGLSGGTQVVPDKTVVYQEGEIVKNYGPGHFEMPDDGFLKRTTETNKYFVSK